MWPGAIPCHDHSTAYLGGKRRRWLGSCAFSGMRIMAMREWRRAVYPTAPNSNGTLFQIAAASTFYTIATLTLPAGSYFITSKVTVSNFDSPVELVCQFDWRQPERNLRPSGPGAG